MLFAVSLWCVIIYVHVSTLLMSENVSREMKIHVKLIIMILYDSGIITYKVHFLQKILGTHYEVLPREDATSDVQSNVLPVDQKESTSITLASDGPVRRERIKTTSPQGEAHIMAPEYSHTLMDSSLGTGSGVSHTSTLDTHGLSTDDIVPSNKRHHPISPPKHPLKLLNIKGHDVTDPSTIDSPLQPHLMDFASKFTQTQLQNFVLRS